uniref:Uncharacterized protein n=1 Tax=Parascaris univalens TaxID=6257 RepID=A0A915C629_PARUN
MFENQLNDEDNEEILMPRRPRRSELFDEPIIIIPEKELQNMIDEEEEANNQPQIVMLPQESTEEEIEKIVPVSEDVLDELELRERIAELANILSERANRAL